MRSKVKTVVLIIKIMVQIWDEVEPMDRNTMTLASEIN